MNKIKWIIAKENKNLSEDIAHQFCVDTTIAQLIINRGLRESKEIHEYLNPGLDNLINPFLLNGIEKAVVRIREAIYKQEKILIYGDYDVDGITSTSLLFSALSNFSKNVYYYIPDRFEEGYGISQQGIAFAIKYEISLIITVDCGITSNNEIEKLRELSIDTIVTDHHEPIGNLPKAFSIINPKSCNYPFKELTGVGVAFKLIQVLYSVLGKKPEEVYNFLDFVALGTIADSVPIIGENRILVKNGLEKLINSDKIGLRTLLANCNNKTLNILSVRDISFGIIPILNSTGRIGDSKQAVDLLLTDSLYRADYLVKNMLKLNEERRSITQKVLNEARGIIQKEDLNNKQKILVLSSEKWHPGIIGIVASRIMEEYAQPVMMISISDGIGKGSGRNQGEFDFSETLHECSDLLARFGGHRYAAGITIYKDKINTFSERINQILSKNPSIKLNSEPIINIDTLIPFNKLSWDFLESMEGLKPFGPGNPQPIFGGWKFPLLSYKKVGKGENHLKLNIGGKEDSFDAIAFHMAEKYQHIINKKTINIAFQLDINNWNGRKTLQLMIKDIKLDYKEI